MNLKVTISDRLIKSSVLILCIIMMDNFFYIIDVNSIDIFGISYGNIWLLVFMTFIAYTYVQYGLWKSKVVYHFGAEVALLASLVFIEAVRGQITFNQSVLAGFIGQMYYLFIIMSYYPLRKLYSKHIIDDRVINKGLIIFGVISFLIYFFQVQFIDSISILYDVHMGNRYGSIRLYVDSIFCVMLGFFGMDSFLRTKKWKGLILIFLTVVYELYISKGRLEFAAFCGSMAIGLILMKRYTGKKTFILGVVVGLVLVFMNTQQADSIFEAIGNLGDNTGTMSVRAYGRALYARGLSESLNSLIFGCGYPASESAKIMSGQNEKVLLVDNGIFAFVYVYGILGLIAVIIWFVKMFRLAWKLYTTKNRYIYLMFIVFNIAMMYNITFWWWKYAWTIIMVIMMCKMEYELYDDTKKNQVVEGNTCFSFDKQYSGTK